jgi:hypothetical protein
MCNSEIEVKLDDLCLKFSEFLIHYELDMRGNKNLGDGDRGVIGEIRKLQDYLRDYPSLPYLLKDSPMKTIGTILAILLFVLALHDVGLLRFLTAYFGLSTP